MLPRQILKVKPSLLVQQRLTVRKPKLLRSNPYRLIAIRTWGIDPNLILIDDEDILVNSRRIILRIETSLDDEEELSDYVKLRLFLARELAMSKYREIYQTA
jgi:hypothetical protein